MLNFPIGLHKGLIEIRRGHCLAGVCRVTPSSEIVMVDFMVVDIDLAYNTLMGRRFIMDLGGIVSLPHLMMKYPVRDKVGVLKGSHKMEKECYYLSTKRICMIEDIDLLGEVITIGDRKEVDPEVPSQDEQTEAVQIGEIPGMVTQIGTTLSPRE